MRFIPATREKTAAGFFRARPGWLKVARMELLGAVKSPPIGELKSSIRKMAEATQIAQVTIDR